MHNANVSSESSPFIIIEQCLANASTEERNQKEEWGELTLLRQAAKLRCNTLNSFTPSSISSLQEGNFVSFVTMVKQPLEPELYLGIMTTDNGQVLSSKYRDSLPEPIQINADTSRLFQRQRYLCYGNLPTQNIWVNGDDSSEENSVDVLVKTYEENDLKVGRLYNVIGIFSNGLEGSSPNIHAISYEEKSATFPLECVKPLVNTRADLLTHITTVLGGDTLTAQIFLLHLISSNQLRTPATIIGKLSLNIAGLHTNSHLPRVLESLLKQLVPFSKYLPLSQEFLHSVTSLRPTMIYDEDRLETGPLQLPPHTSLLIDQTSLTEGKLDETALSNLKVLQLLASSQQLNYNYSYDVPMPVDIPIVVVSTEKSILPVDITVYHNISTDTHIDLPELSHDVLQNFRTYILHARSLVVQIDNDLAEFIPLDLTDGARKESDMHRLLNLARLIGASHLSPKLLQEHWQHTKHLDAEISRCNIRSKGEP